MPEDLPPSVKKHKVPPEVLPPAATLPVSVSIPIGPLGYAPPGPTYLGRNNTLVSLDFIDENRLLFTFRAPGLLHRESDDGSSDRERQVKAVVLTLPDGKVQSQALMTVPDPHRYLWMLGDGRFLIHQRDGLALGNDKLELKPFLQIPGELVWLKIDPTEKVLVAESLEPAAQGSPRPPSPQAPAATIRAFELSSGKILQTRHPQAAIEFPMDANGELEIVHDKLDQWTLKEDAYAGGTRVLSHVESTCQPSAWFVTSAVLLVAGCNPSHNHKLDAVSTTGQQMWEIETPVTYIPPLWVMSRDGKRFARETIVLKSGVRPSAQKLWIKTVKGQAVRVFATATGKVEMETPVSPILDGGGNLAFSPSGRRVAVLHQRAIEIFDLPAAAF